MSQFGPATFQVLSSRTWWVAATILNRVSCDSLLRSKRIWPTNKGSSGHLGFVCELEGSCLCKDNIGPGGARMYLELYFSPQEILISPSDTFFHSAPQLHGLEPVTSILWFCFLICKMKGLNLKIPEVPSVILVNILWMCLGSTFWRRTLLEVFRYFWESPSYCWVCVPQSLQYVVLKAGNRIRSCLLNQEGAAPFGQVGR